MATLDIDKFTSYIRSEARPRPYSRLETDSELLARCTAKAKAEGIALIYCLSGSRESRQWEAVEVKRYEVESVAKHFGIIRRIVWVPAPQRLNSDRD